MGRFLVCLLFCLTCVFKLEAREIRVFAASSLTDVLSEIGKEFEKNNKTKVIFSFDASSRLARQINEGAKADLFFSADEIWNDFLIKEGQTTPIKTLRLLSNRLVLISQNYSKLHVGSLSALTQVSYNKLALSQETVPAGKYALEALQKAGVHELIKNKIVHADNVRSTLAWVARGEADLGIVFLTDAKIESRVKVLYSIDPGLHTTVIYPVSLIGHRPFPLAREFFDFLQSDKALRLYHKYGFQQVKETWK